MVSVLVVHYYEYLTIRVVSDTEYGHLYDYSRTQPCPALPLSPPPPAAPPAEERKPELPPRVPRTANSKCRQRSSSVYMDNSSSCSDVALLNF